MAQLLQLIHAGICRENAYGRYHSCGRNWTATVLENLLHMVVVHGSRWRVRRVTVMPAASIQSRQRLRGIIFPFPVQILLSV